MATQCQLKRGMSGNGKIKKEEKVILLVQANNSTKTSTQICVQKRATLEKLNALSKPDNQMECILNISNEQSGKSRR